MHPVAISACLLGGLSIGGSFRRRCYSPRPARGGAPATGVVAVCVMAAGVFVFLPLTIHPGRGCFCFSCIGNLSWPQVLLVFPSPRLQPPPCPTRCSSHRLCCRVCYGRRCFCFSFTDHLSWPRVLLFVFHWQFVLAAGAFVFCFADLSYRPQLLLSLFLEHVLLVACALVFVSLKPIYSWSHELRSHVAASLLKSLALV